MVVALTGEIDSWNPYTTRELTSAGILDLLYPRLVMETDDGGFSPWLAEFWEFDSEGLELTFRIRGNAVWSDGTPVTCRDVLFTYEAQVAEELAWHGAFVKERIASVECPDEREVRFRFTEAYPHQLLDANDNAVVPAAYADVPLERWAATVWEDRIISSGPFRLSSVRPGQEAVLERDESWWGAGNVHVDRAVLRVYPDTTAAVGRFLHGEVDLVGKLPPMKAEAVARRSGLRVVELSSLAYTYLAWNALAPGAYVEDRRERGCSDERPCDESAEEIRRLQRARPHPILADARIRRALSLAIDRRDLIDGLLGGYGRIGVSPIVSALWAHDPSAGVPFDPIGAAELLDGAGWRLPEGGGVREHGDRPLTLSVIVNAENRLRRDVLERVAANLSAIGVELRAEPLPRREFVARARNKDFDAVLSGWWAGTRVQPQNLLHSNAAVDRGNNLASWSTSASDELLDRASRAGSREQALPLWAEWQAIFRIEQPLTVLYEERRLLAMSGRVRGPDPPFLNPYLGLCDWWIESDSAAESR